MAKIPSVETLGYRVPREVGRPTRARPVELSFEGVATQTAKAMREAQRIFDERDLANAKADFEQFMLRRDEEAEQDPDFDTVVERHRGDSMEGLGMAAANISNPEVRNAFVNDARVQIERHNLAVADKARARMNDRTLAKSNERADDLINRAMDPNVDPNPIMDALILDNKSLADTQVISAVDAGKRDNYAQKKIIEGRVHNMNPFQRLEFLRTKSKWRDEMDPAMRERMEKEAEDEVMDEQAHAFAMTLKEMPQSSAMALLNDKAREGNWSDDLYQKARTRVLRYQDDNKVEKYAAAKELHEVAYPAIYLGETTFDELMQDKVMSEQIMQLDEDQIDSLKRAQDKATKRRNGEFVPEISDASVLAELRRLRANGASHAALRDVFSRKQHLLNGPDFKTWDIYSSPDKSKDPQYKSILNPRQLLDKYIEDFGVDATEERMIWDEIMRKNLNYSRQNQVESAPDDIINGWIRQEFGDVVSKRRRRWVDQKKKVYEMPQEQRDTYSAITSMYQSAGLTLDEAEEQYNTLYDEDRIQLMAAWGEAMKSGNRTPQQIIMEFEQWKMTNRSEDYPITVDIGQTPEQVDTEIPLSP